MNWLHVLYSFGARFNRVCNFGCAGPSMFRWSFEACIALVLIAARHCIASYMAPSHDVNAGEYGVNSLNVASAREYSLFFSVSFPNTFSKSPMLSTSVIRDPSANLVPVFRPDGEGVQKRGGSVYMAIVV